jgi:hypothetical protein
MSAMAVMLVMLVMLASLMLLTVHVAQPDGQRWTEHTDTNIVVETLAELFDSISRYIYPGGHCD